LLAQKIWRGGKVRYLYRTDYSQYKTKEMQTRNQIFRDLRKSEIALISKLELINNNYYAPLRENLGSKKPMITKKDLETFFGDMEQILLFHLKMREGFELLRLNWPKIDDIGNTFLQQAEAIKPYGPFVENFYAAFSHIDFIKSKNEQFAEFLAAADKKSSLGGFQISLKELLYVPINQIQNYEQALDKMISLTPHDFRGSEALRKAHVVLQETNKFIKESLDEAQNRVGVFEVQRALEDHEILKKKRKFVMTWESDNCIVGTKKHGDVVVFLFNDVLLISKLKSKDKHKVVEEINLDSDLQVAKSSEGPKFFDVISPKVKYTFKFDKAEEAERPFTTISRVIEETNNKIKVFGLPFSFLIERDKPADGIPTIISDLVKFLDTKKEADGIFRISATVKEVATLRGAYDKGNSGAIDWKTTSEYAAGGLLKQWFRELPEPIFEFNFYDNVLSLANVEDDKARITKLKDLLKTIPKPNLAVVKYLLNFFENGLRSFRRK